MNSSKDGNDEVEKSDDEESVFSDKTPEHEEEGDGVEEDKEQAGDDTNEEDEEHAAAADKDDGKEKPATAGEYDGKEKPKESERKDVE